MWLIKIFLFTLQWQNDDRLWLELYFILALEVALVAFHAICYLSMCKIWQVVDSHWEHSFVNSLGCFIIGLLYGLFDRGNLMNTNLKLFLTVGFCGGFTTFSTFMGDNFQLIKAENFFYSSVYLGASIICGYLLLFLGYSLIKLI